VAIPDYEAFMDPMIRAISDGADHRFRDVVETLIAQVGINDDEREQLLPSGQQTVVSNRINWAKTYLKKAGLVEYPSRGMLRLTKEGRLIATRKERIDNRFLSQFPTYVAFTDRAIKLDESKEETPEPFSESTPEEAMDRAASTLRTALADELLERVRNCSPAFFERLVVELLVAMGYGGSLDDAGQAVGKSGDGGIDGIIKEDKLGLDIVCLQAKRWTAAVGRPEVQAFAGSMEGFRARKGVLITTSTFSREAREFITRIERKIVLIDGQQLARLMIDHNVGVSPSQTYVVKKADPDYFEEE
jgi:restriction system protein